MVDSCLIITGVGSVASCLSYELEYGTAMTRGNEGDSGNINVWFDSVPWRLAAFIVGRTISLLRYIVVSLRM